MKNLRVKNLEALRNQNVFEDFQQGKEKKEKKEKTVKKGEKNGK